MKRDFSVQTRDLNKWRLGAALLFTPIPAVAFFSLFKPSGFWIFLEMVPWFAILQLSHHVVASCRGKMTRLGCVMAGTIAGATFSDAAVIVERGFYALFVDPATDFTAMPLEILQSASWKSSDFLTGFAIYCLLGVFTGWLYWRLGVRGAKADDNVSSVFT